ncbi:FAD binding domain-containing protein [Xylariaceae sp. FL1651]|nr:FAD binding domain-containing protein [Xylariaceae sp. FL1651]
MALPDSIDADVVIVGAGPIGLNLAYQLRRFSTAPVVDPLVRQPISVRIIEALPKPVQQTFGRAVTFWSRPMELLCQLGLGESILNHCFAVRSSAAYDANGEEVFGRGWSFVEGITDTRFKFASVLRQKYVEEICRAKLETLGVKVHDNHKFLDLAVDENVQVGEKGRVQATILDRSLGEGKEREYTANCRYLIGCDGTRTVVRGAAGIESDGSRTEDKWVRVDGVLKYTTMPKPFSYGSLESPTYGNVLWIPLDHGATRIGFAMKEERTKLYEKIDEEVYAKEALLSIAPFKAEYERVDWASVYSVGQRLARNFWAKKSVFIAGDAAHSHSSGAGQGMNTGVQDAVNLGWKLALVLTGKLKPEVLETYELERRPNAAKLIRYDEDISVLITGRLPKGWKGNKEPNAALGDLLKEATGFNTGLTIAYAPNIAVLSDNATCNGTEHFYSQPSTIPAPAMPGYRAPDVQLLRPALWSPVWLQEITPNVARFYVLTFIGKSPASRASFHIFKSDLEKEKRLRPWTMPELDGSGAINAASEYSTTTWPVDFLTILSSKTSNVWAELGTDAVGSTYYETDDGGASQRYGVDSSTGAVFVLRPDGFIGARFTLGLESVAGIVKYLGELLIQ